MGLHLVMCPRLQLTGGASASLFPKAEKLLGDNQVEDILWEGFGLQELEDQYRSKMDCLVVETFTFWRESCLAYYAEEGPPLRELISKAEARAFDIFLVGCMKLALAIGAHRADWPRLVGSALKVAQ